MTALSGGTKIEAGRNSSATRAGAQAGAFCVLQVIPDLGAGGAEQTTIDVAAALVSQGGRALVATCGGAREAELFRVGGEFLQMPVHTKNPYSMACNILRLAQVIDRDKVDIVHARSRAPAWSALAAARIMGKPFVTTYHGTYTGKTGLKRWYNSVMVKGDGVIANSGFIRDHIVSHHGLSAERIDVIPRGSDMGIFCPDRVDPSRVTTLREKWCSGTSAKVLLLPGRLTRWKGQQVFVEALEILTRQNETSGDNWVAVLMGDAQGRDHYVEELKVAAQRAGIADRIIFENHCSDMPAAYLAADFVVSPATSPEAFGRVAVEAQAMGRPPLVADHGGARETVVVGQGNSKKATGWRIPPGDAPALARTLNDALALDEPALKEMGARGRENVTAHFSLKGMTDHTLSVYERVMVQRT
jgi:glycosyltransferase involved in cell wall biosynthesis